MLKSGTQTAPPRYIPSQRFAWVKVSFMRNRKHRNNRSSGQALIESAILIPFLLGVIFNAINFGYFYYVAQNLTAATRSGALYSILGNATPLGTAPPAPGSETTQTSVSYLVYQDMLGALPASGTKASVRVCSGVLGTTGTGTSTKAVCSSVYGPAFTFPAIEADPEAPTYILNRIDVAYEFKPLINGTPFGLVLLATPVCSSSSGTISCTFQRHVSMRVMN